MNTPKITAIFLSILVLASCGSQNTDLNESKDVKLNETKASIVTFPMSGKIINLLKGTSIQVQIESNKDKNTIEVSQNVSVVFDGKPVTKDSLKIGQTVYIESTDSRFATNIVITDWPGLDKVGKTVSIGTDAVVESFINYITSNHPELEIGKPSMWFVTQKDSPVGDDEMTRALSFANYTFRIVWTKDQKEPEYDASLSKKGSMTVIWSGRFRKDGKIIEERYEKP
jgi:hypothetical protein